MFLETIIDYKLSYQEIRNNIQDLFNFDNDFVYKNYEEKNSNFLLIYKKVFKEELNSQNDLKYKLNKLIEIYNENQKYKIKNICIVSNMQTERTLIKFKIEEK